MVCIKVWNLTSHNCRYCIENLIYIWWCSLV
jgi:hypothetical protein